MMAILFGEMLQFGLVLGTIMMGFTVSFFALFGEDQSYGEAGDIEYTVGDPVGMGYEALYAGLRAFCVACVLRVWLG